MMGQLGEQSGQLFGAYMPAMAPAVPEFDDGETRLQWKFQNSRAQGSVNDETPHRLRRFERAAMKAWFG